MKYLLDVLIIILTALVSLQGASSGKNTHVSEIVTEESASDLKFDSIHVGTPTEVITEESKYSLSELSTNTKSENTDHKNVKRKKVAEERIVTIEENNSAQNSSFKITETHPEVTSPMASTNIDNVTTDVNTGKKGDVQIVPISEIITVTEEELINNVASDIDEINSFTSTENDLEDTSVYLRSSGEETSTDSICSSELFRIEDVNITSADNSIQTSWKPHKYIDKCVIKYNVNITAAKYDSLEIPYFRQEINTSHQFNGLQECTAYNISIQPNEGDVYQETVRTLPGKIENLNITVKNKKTEIRWSPSKYAKCSKYRILLNDSLPFETQAAFFEYDTSLYCTAIEVRIVDENQRTGEADTRAVPGPIQNLAITPDDHTLAVTWDAPVDISCVEGYRIQIVGESDFVQTSDTQYNFTNLEACKSYTVEVAAYSNTDEVSGFVGGTSRTSEPEYITSVTNLALTEVDNALNATWEPPTLQGSCITRYRLTMWNQAGSTVDDVTDRTFYVYSPLIGCMEYTVQVIPGVGEAKEGNPQSQTREIGSLASSPPGLRSNTPDKTSSVMTFNLQAYPSNMCTITHVSVECEALEENNEMHPWIITPQVAYTNYSDSTARPGAIVNITDLSEFTNYTCYATVTNSWGESDRSSVIKFQTLEDVPSVPENLTASEVNSTGFVVTWNEPYKVPGLFTYYHLNITGVNPLHYIPDGCAIISENVLEDLSEDINNFHFFEGLPNFYYIVSVAAATTVGAGPNAEIQVSTLPYGSEAPRNLIVDVTVEQGYIYNATALLEWILPCNTNGDISGFQILIHGVPLGEDLEEDDRSDVIPANVPIENVAYNFEVKNIRALFNYTVSLYAISTDTEYQGDTVQIGFISPEGYPSAPTITNIAVDQNVTITWDRPDRINGELQSYLIEIAPSGPLHFIPDGCDVNLENETFEVPAETTSLIFVGFPNYNYTVTVAASTIAGFGPQSDADEFHTLPANSEAPENLTYNITNTLGVVYDANALLDWELPCNTNGDISHFNVEIFGESLDEGPDDNRQETVEINDPTDIEYNFEVPIQPLRNYTIWVYAVSPGDIIGEAEYITFLSPDGLPSAPTITNVAVTNDSSVILMWDEPAYKNGILQTFEIFIQPVERLHIVPEDCPVVTENKTYITEAAERSFIFEDGVPNYNYTVRIAASTRAGYGLPSSSEAFQTSESEPEAVTDLVLVNLLYEEQEVFEANATISFVPPCDLNDNFEYYEVNVSGERPGFEDINNVTHISDIDETSLVIDLRPEYIYTISCTVITQNFESNATFLEPFMSPSGVPPAAVFDIIPPYPNGSRTAIFVLSDDIFDNSYGNILYYSLILSGINKHENLSSFGFWNGTEDSWPSIGSWSEDDELLPYQTTPIRWNPFLNRAEADYIFVIGAENCTEVESFCNGPLRPNTEYVFIVRGFTNRGFRDTEHVRFITPEDLEPGLNWALILGPTFGILLVLVLLVFIFILWRRRRKQKLENSALDPLIPASIPIKQFPDHYNDIKNNLNKLKSEYTLLETKSAEHSLATDIAVAEENKKKNRYINILPYNDTRVILDTDKNANYPDYINASYIKGYSGALEYIATQGPLETTVVDFWRMVIQENVSVIVMAAQFVEQSKQKCYKYFPSNHETMEIGDEIEIRCSNELNFGGYIVRSLLVQRELSQWMITHLQFTDWPDFGCPNGTETMLQFCNVMRSYIEKNKSKTIVHCSAGVGRTGTLIAVDILLQTIENNGDINVFKTVYNMRRQRSHMVQTEKQYMYIHTCVKDQIVNPLKKEENNSEPIYENVDSLQTILNDKVTIAESAL